MALTINKVKFERIMGLGPERLTAVNNALSQGAPCLQVARLIQGDWKLITDIGEESLAKQLGRYKEDRLGHFQNASTAVIPLDATAVALLDTLNEQDALIRAQKSRVALFIAEERKGRKADKDVSAEIRLLNELIRDKLRMEFDVGQRAFCGPLPVAPGKPGQMPVVTTTMINTPQGTAVQTQVREAVDQATTILDRYAKPAIDGESTKQS